MKRMSHETVRNIPPIPKEYKKLKAAAYCRVSTSGPEQLRSLEIQIKTYTKMIRNHADWIYAGVFYDIESGLRRSGRTGLDKMLKKAAKGKIDYIITKSISRVSRDTLEVLKISLDLTVYSQYHSFDSIVDLYISFWEKRIDLPTHLKE